MSFNPKEFSDRELVDIIIEGKFDRATRAVCFETLLKRKYNHDLIKLLQEKMSRL